MDGSAVNQIKEIVENNFIIKGEDGKQYCSRSMKPVLFQPNIATINIHSLSGIVEYLNSELDKIEEKVIIHIEDFDSVKIVGGCREPNLTRNVYLHSKIRNYKWFQFEDFLPHENFIIDLRSMFEETEDLLKVIKYASKLSVKNEISVSDDGCSQMANVKKGVSGAVQTKEVAPSIVILKPYRTFREIEQPESPFLFRIKESSGMPLCALFEAGGEIWREVAIKRIRSYLLSEIGKDIPIVT